MMQPQTRKENLMKTLLGMFKPMAMPFLVLIALLPQSALAQGGYWGMGPGMMGSWGMGWFGGVFIILFWILVIVALVFFIRWLVRTTGNGQKQGLSRSRALEILKERYARGEINTQEFDEKRRLLES